MQDVWLFSAAVKALNPNPTGPQIAALLDGKISPEVANHWFAGRRHAPRWALDRLAQRIREHTAPALAIVSQIDKAPERPGKQAGARNLAAYLAKRNA